MSKVRRLHVWQKFKAKIDKARELKQFFSFLIDITSITVYLKLFKLSSFLNQKMEI